MAAWESQLRGFCLILVGAYLRWRGFMGSSAEELKGLKASIFALLMPAMVLRHTWVSSIDMTLATLIGWSLVIQALWMYLAYVFVRTLARHGMLPATPRQGWYLITSCGSSVGIALALLADPQFGDLAISAAALYDIGSNAWVCQVGMAILGNMTLVDARKEAGNRHGEATTGLTELAVVMNPSKKEADALGEPGAGMPAAEPSFVKQRDNDASGSAGALEATDMSSPGASPPARVKFMSDEDDQVLAEVHAVPSSEGTGSPPSRARPPSTKLTVPAVGDSAAEQLGGRGRLASAPSLRSRLSSSISTHSAAIRTSRRSLRPRARSTWRISETALTCYETDPCALVDLSARCRGVSCLSFSSPAVNSPRANDSDGEEEEDDDEGELWEPEKEHEFNIGEILVNQVLKNPIMIAFITGITMSTLEVKMPDFLENLCHHLSTSFSCMVFFLIGASLELEMPTWGSLRPILTTLGVRLSVQCVLAILFPFLLMNICGVSCVWRRAFLMCIMCPSTNMVMYWTQEQGHPAEVSALYLTTSMIVGLLILTWVSIVTVGGSVNSDFCICGDATAGLAGLNATGARG